MVQEFADVVAGAQPEAQIRLVVGDIGIPEGAVGVLGHRVEDVHPGRDRAAQEIGLREAQRDVRGDKGQVGGEGQRLPFAQQVAFRDLDQPQGAVGRGITETEAELAGRLLLDIHFDDRLVRRRPGQGLDVDVGKEPEIGQPLLGTLQLRAVEGIALDEAELAPDDAVQGSRIALDVDPLDIDLGALVDREGDVDGLLLRIAVEAVLNVDEGITQAAQRVVQGGRGLVDIPLVVPLALLHLHKAAQDFRIEVLERGLDVHLADLVALPLVQREGDVEGILLRRQLGDRRDHLEVDVAVHQVEVAQPVAIDLETIGIVGIGRDQEAVPGRLGGEDDAAQLAVGERLVAHEADLADVGAAPLLDLEDEVHPILVELDDLGVYRRAEASAAPVEIEDPLHIRLHAALRQHRPGLFLDLGEEILGLQVIVTFEGDRVDDRILDHLDDQGIALAPEGDVGEEARGEEILQGLVDAVGSKGIAGVELHVGAHRVRLDTLRALDLDVGDGIAAEHVLGERRGDGRQERQKHQGEAGRQQ